MAGTTTAHRVAAIAVGLSVLAPLPSLAQTVVNACGMTVAGEAVLGADLDCTATSPGLILGLDSSLALSGHTFAGYVQCAGDCIVAGPGTITGPAFQTLTGDNIVIRQGAEIDGAVVAAFNVLVEDSTIVGSASGYTVQIVNSTVRDGHGISATKTLLDHATISGHSFHGILGQYVTALDSNVTGNIVGVECSSSSTRPGKVVAENSQFDSNSGVGINCNGLVKLEGGTANGNGTGVQTSRTADINGRIHGKARLSGVQVQGNRTGVSSARAQLKGSDVSMNLEVGIDSWRVKMKSGTIAVGNGVDPECGVSISCSDVRSESRPQLTSDSSCGTATDYAGVSWGVCGP